MSRDHGWVRDVESFVSCESGGVVNRLSRAAAAGVAGLAVAAGSVGVAAAADTGFYLESVQASGSWVKPGGAHW